MAGHTSGWYEVVPPGTELVEQKNTIPCTGSKAGAQCDRNGEATVREVLQTCAGTKLHF